MQAASLCVAKVYQLTWIRSKPIGRFSRGKGPELKSCLSSFCWSGPSFHRNKRITITSWCLSGTK